MAVCAQKRGARHRVALKMHLVTDAVSGPRIVKAVLGGHVLQVYVVVGVTEVALQHVVIDVADRQLRLHARHADGLELQVRQGAGGVLRQGLIDAE